MTFFNANREGSEARHILITGGSSGIGKACAIQYAQAGDHVSIIARDIDKLQKAKQEIEQARKNSNQKIMIFSADVAESRLLEATIHRVVEKLGTPDILITSAGISQPGYFGELPLSTFERTMSVNYFGTLYSVKTVLPLMLQRGTGHIAILSSGAGVVGVFGYTAYGATKFALRGLAESLRAELKTSNVNISIVYPGDTDTPMLEMENKTKPIETRQISAVAKTFSAEYVATVIIKGINKNLFAITPGFDMQLLYRLHCLLAPLINRYFDHLAAKAHT